jgi:hypothetical protein
VPVAPCDVNEQLEPGVEGQSQLGSRFAKMTSPRGCESGSRSDLKLRTGAQSAGRGHLAVHVPVITPIVGPRTGARAQ